MFQHDFETEKMKTPHLLIKFLFNDKIMNKFINVLKFTKQVFEF